MNKKKKNTAVIILASGSSQRFKSQIPKQYKKINNLTILEICIENFLNNSNINSLYVTYNKKHRKFITPIIEKYKEIKFLVGDKCRQSSSFKAIKLIFKNKKHSNILIHDSVRPFISKKIVNNLIRELKYNDGVIPVIKTVDSIKIVDKNIVINKVDRSNLYFSQTPQAFLLEKIIKAYDNINKNNLKKYTDDAEIFCKYGYKLKAIDGDEKNFKITTINDFLKAKSMFNSAIRITRVGQGIDYHAFTKGDKFVLFGVTIPFKKGIKAHSDGDVGIHALIDAILGALAAGDIGNHFPDNDKKYKNICSFKLLEKILSILKKNKGQIVHIDNTIICEEPKVGKYISKMKRKISHALNLDLASISIKATTTEKMGFIGRNEGIAAYSLATIQFQKYER